MISCALFQVKHNLSGFVISNPGIPGEKSFILKQISPRELVEMTFTGFVIASLCPINIGYTLEMTF